MNTPSQPSANEIVYAFATAGEYLGRLIAAQLLFAPEPTADPPRKLLAMKQAADYLNMGLTRFRSLLKTAEIPVIKNGNRSMFAPASLDEWIARQVSGGTSKPPVKKRGSPKST